MIDEKMLPEESIKEENIAVNAKAEVENKEAKSNEINCENVVKTSDNNVATTAENIVESADKTTENDVENLEKTSKKHQKNGEKTAKNAQKNDENLQKNEAKTDKNGKKFKLGDVGKCTLVLVVIALVAGLLLGVVNWVTYVDPDGTISENCATYYGASEVKKEETLAVAYDKNNYVKACFVAYGDDGNPIGYCYYSVGGGAKDGSLELLVYIGSDGVIDEITVYEQGETAGYFDKVEKANKQKYIGLDIGKINKLQLLSSGQTATEAGEVSAVSQATYTSTGYHNAIASAVYAYHEIFGGAQ